MITTKVIKIRNMITIIVMITALEIIVIDSNKSNHDDNK